MNKEDFEELFPDIKMQQFETVVVENRKTIEELVVSAMNSLKMGLVYYESYGKKIKVFTSEKMRLALQGMEKGAKVVNPNTGQQGTVVSEKPFIVCGIYCIRVRLGDSEDLYDCSFFVE